MAIKLGKKKTFKQGRRVGQMRPDFKMKDAASPRVKAPKALKTKKVKPASAQRPPSSGATATVGTKGPHPSPRAMERASANARFKRPAGAGPTKPAAAHQPGRPVPGSSTTTTPSTPRLGRPGNSGSSASVASKIGGIRPGNSGETASISNPKIKTTGIGSSRGRRMSGKRIAY